MRCFLCAVRGGRFTLGLPLRWDRHVQARCGSLRMLHTVITENALVLGSRRHATRARRARRALLRRVAGQGVHAHRHNQRQQLLLLATRKYGIRLAWGSAFGSLAHHVHARMRAQILKLPAWFVKWKIDAPEKRRGGFWPARNGSSSHPAPSTIGMMRRRCGAFAKQRRTCRSWHWYRVTQSSSEYVPTLPYAAARRVAGMQAKEDAVTVHE